MREDERRMYRQLSLGETLCKTLGIFFSRLDVFLMLSLGVTVPLCLTAVLFVASLVDVKNDDDVWDYVVNHLPSCLAYLIFQPLLYIVLVYTAEGAMVSVLAQL